MREYELILVLKSSLSEAERNKFLSEVKAWIKDAKIVKETSLGSKALAYKIKKELTGFYYTFNLEMAKLAPDLEKRLLTNDNVLRHLVIRKK